MIEKLKIAIEHEGTIPLFIFIIYLETFMLFPNLTLNKASFTSNFLSKNNNAWGM